MSTTRKLTTGYCRLAGTRLLLSTADRTESIGSVDFKLFPTSSLLVICASSMGAAIVCLTLCDIAIGDTAQPVPAVSRVVMPVQTAICGKRNIPLKDEFGPAYQKIFSVAVASGAKTAGPPIIVFNVPVSQDQNPDDNTDWTLCVPVSGQPTTALPSDVALFDLPAVTALVEICGTTDTAAAACSQDIRAAMQAQNLKMTRLWSSSKRPDGKIEVILPVDAGPAP